MWLPLVAALACALPASPGASARGGEGDAMSLPLDAGPASQVGDWRSLPPSRPWSWALVPAAPQAGEAALFSPREVECAEVAPAPDCGATLASLWSPTFLPRCDLPRPSHTRAGRVRRGRSPSSRVAAAGLRDAPAPLLADPSPPPHLPARARLIPPAAAPLPRPLALTLPPAPPDRRIDRPPRAAIV